MLSPRTRCRPAGGAHRRPTNTWASRYDAAYVVALRISSHGPSTTPREGVDAATSLAQPAYAMDSARPPSAICATQGTTQQVAETVQCSMRQAPATSFSTRRPIRELRTAYRSASPPSEAAAGRLSDRDDHCGLGMICAITVTPAMDEGFCWGRGARGGATGLRFWCGAVRPMAPTR